ncbi:YOR062C [Saccharomyces arboricola H-6]|uniref:YOR062C n=1 Tax=Saccharomyces arboricola (strain H-6 / AS 2.3317 / CBS 10644) TaxID=1160507 RepID=J8LI24_SACAR|nr:YOR062C [Saccharomyces arboricola H-6]
MTSLDDSVLTKKNIALLDNATNYTRPAVDYFRFTFDYDRLDVPITWRLLWKMRKHKLLRLPSCSSENEFDYTMYMARLHHCMWRRWSINHFKLDDLKIDPLSINWNKERDVTLLYGPDLAEIYEREPILPKVYVRNKKVQEKQLFGAGNDGTGSTPLHKDGVVFPDDKVPSQRTISFNDTVRRRDIDKRGRFQESCVLINDINHFQEYSIIWDDKRHRYCRQVLSDMCEYDHALFHSKEAPRDKSYENTIIPQNLHSITEGSYIYIK